MDRALSDNEYFLNEYEKEMSQEAIYAEADALMGMDDFCWSIPV